MTIIPLSSAGETGAGVFSFTLCAWHNHRAVIGRDSSGQPMPGDWKKVLSHTGSFEQFEYGERYLTASPGITCLRGRHQFCEEDPQRPGRIRHQVGVVCTRKSGLIVLDVDDPDEWDQNGIPLGRESATVVSGRGYHIYVDARAFRGSWPTQGPVRGGDIKSNGFVAAPESIHFSGRKYMLADES